MTADMVRTLYRYSAWATARICQAATRLSPGELAAPSGASFSSVRETLVHIMAAQWIWLSRWKSTSPTSLLDPREFPDLASIRARWDPIEVDTQRFVSTLTDADLATVVEYRNTRGERWAYPCGSRSSTTRLNPVADLSGPRRMRARESDRGED
jgi:uncharacterized damage-inducible protein DinB